jgi:putative nucleotidyltransferase with HDIG domain
MRYGEEQESDSSNPNDSRKPSQTSAVKQASKIVEITGDLPAMPHIAAQVMEKLSSPNATPRDIHALLTKDQGLAARVLKVANSPYYGASRSISSLRDAILFMGFDSIRSLVMTAVMKGMFSATSLAEQLLWEHSIGCAAISRRIATEVDFSGNEEVFLAGLMHDIGKAVMFLRVPSKMREIMEEVYNSGTDFAEVEQQMLGFTHAQVGQMVADKWRFAVDIEDAIANHHQPDQARSARQLAHIVSLGNSLCHKLEIGPTRKPDLDVSNLQSAQALGISADEISELLEQMSENLKKDDGSIPG